MLIYGKQLLLMILYVILEARPQSSVICRFEIPSSKTIGAHIIPEVAHFQHISENAALVELFNG